jgi:hypothetical protein
MRRTRCPRSSLVLTGAPRLYRQQFQPDPYDTKGYFQGVGSFGNPDSTVPGFKETDGNYKYVCLGNR